MSCVPINKQVIHVVLFFFLIYFCLFHSDSRRRAKARRKPTQEDESSNDAPEEVTAIDAKAIEQKEQIARELAASRASQRAADAKQRRRDVAQQRQLASVKRKKSILPVQSDTPAEESPGSAAPSEVVPRGKNHQFLSDEIIAELARQCVFCVPCGRSILTDAWFCWVCAGRMNAMVRSMLTMNAREPTPSDAKSNVNHDKFQRRIE